VSRTSRRDRDAQRVAIRAAAGRLLAGTPLRSATGKLTGTELITESGLRRDVVYGDHKDLVEEFQAQVKAQQFTPLAAPGPSGRARQAGQRTRQSPAGTSPRTGRQHNPAPDRRRTGHRTRPGPQRHDHQREGDPASHSSGARPDRPGQLVRPRPRPQLAPAVRAWTRALPGLRPKSDRLSDWADAELSVFTLKPPTRGYNALEAQEPVTKGRYSPAVSEVLIQTMSHVSRLALAKLRS
jgi:hypothetical protein